MKYTKHLSKITKAMAFVTVLMLYLLPLSAQNLVAFWPFEETAGATTADVSGNGNDGTINGPTSTTGKVDLAFQFDGIIDNITIPRSASLDSITEEITMIAWVKMSVDTRQTILERWLINDYAFVLDVDDAGKVNFGLCGDGTTVDQVWLTSAGSVTADTWTHVAATSDGTTMKVYIDNVLDTNTIAPPSAIFTAAGNVHIGGWEIIPGMWSNPFNGTMDEVKLYNRALTAQEITDDYNGLTAPTGTISGTVTDGITGNPIPDATVTNGTRSDSTDAGGNYMLEYLPEGTYTVTASKSGYLISEIDNVIVTEDDTTTVDFQLTEVPTGTISGTVTDGITGNPIPDATVTNGTRSDSTDASGNYTLSDIPVNIYTITASKSGYLISEIDDVIVTGNDTTTVDFQLTEVPDGAISGTVTDSITGNPIQGATVSDGTRFDDTDSDGNYTIEDVPVIHTYTVTAYKSGYLLLSVDSVIVSEDDTTTVDFQLSVASGPVCFWPFEETSGTTAYDSSGNGNDGTIDGPTSTTGKVGLAYLFDGDNLSDPKVHNHIIVPTSASLDAITSEITLITWVKTPVTGERQNLFERYLCDYPGFRSFLFDINNDEGHLNFGLSADEGGDDREFILSAGTITDNEWTHVAATSDGTTMKIYINGVLDTVTGDSPAGIFSAGTPLHLGGWEFKADAWYYPLSGVMDEVKIYNRALSAQEITDDYSLITGTISGTVTDDSTDLAIEGVIVSDGTRSDTTDAGGNYILEYISEGTYTVTASKSGYLISAIDSVIVTGYDTTIVDFQLTPASDLVGFWPFEEASGTVTADLSIYNNDGELFGPTSTSGIIESAFQFDGTDDYVTVLRSVSLDGIADEITMISWVKMPVGNRQTILERWLLNDHSFILDVDDAGKVNFGLSEDGVDGKFLNSTNTITSDSWSHVAATSDGTTMKIYINSLLDPHTSSSPSYIHPSSANLHIGRWMAGSNEWYYPFDGTMDEVKIYNRALTTQEIEEDYNLAPVGIRENPVSLLLEDGLLQAYPNPFNYSTTIGYKTAVTGRVTISIYNLSGQKIRTLVNETRQADHHSVVWDGTNARGGSAGSGIYVCTLHIDNKPIATKKLVLLR